MAAPVLWKDTDGHALLNQLVKKLVPQWTNGLREQQDDVVAYILYGEDTLYCTATGGGKSATFIVPILVHRELHRNRHLYPTIPQTRVREKPVGIVVTPTKGLANNLVCFMSYFG